MGATAAPATSNPRPHDAHSGTIELVRNTLRRIFRGRRLRFGLSLFLFPISVLALAHYRTADSAFSTLANIASEIVKNGTVLTLLALGASLVMATSEIDLSALGVATVSGVIFANTLSYFGPSHGAIAFLSAAAAAIAFAMLSGVLVSYCVVKLRAPALIFTWAMGGIYAISSILLTRCASASVHPTISGVPLPWQAPAATWAFGHRYFLCSVITILLSIVILAGTSLPHRATAVGGNSNSASYAGVSINRTISQCYIVCAVLAGIAGIVHTLLNGQATTRDLESSINGLVPIAVALLGGTSLLGGYLSLWSVVASSLFWTVAKLLGPILPVFDSIQAEMGQGLFYLMFVIVAAGLGRALAPPAAKIYAEKEAR